MSKEVKNIDKSFIQKMGKELLKNDINIDDNTSKKLLALSVFISLFFSCFILFSKLLP